jgi:hypothetical protein
MFAGDMKKPIGGNIMVKKIQKSNKKNKRNFL